MNTRTHRAFNTTTNATNATTVSTRRAVDTVFSSAPQRLLSTALALCMTLVTLVTVGQLASGYQHDAQMAALKAAPAAQQVVVVGQRAVKG